MSGAATEKALVLVAEHLRGLQHRQGREVGAELSCKLVAETGGRRGSDLGYPVALCRLGSGWGVSAPLVWADLLSERLPLFSPALCPVSLSVGLQCHTSCVNGVYLRAETGMLFLRS